MAMRQVKSTPAPAAGRGGRPRAAQPGGADEGRVPGTHVVLQLLLSTPLPGTPRPPWLHSSEPAALLSIEQVTG